MAIFNKADILLPKNIDMKKWSVIACDQYTSEADYWSEVEEVVGEEKSTLRLTLPEIYLSETKERVDKVNSTMESYLRGDVFTEYKDSMILVKRECGGGVRYGIVGAVDLDEYDFTEGSSSYIRASEKTVPERIPPRVEIRKNASLELPHVMMLVDDRENEVLLPIIKDADKFDVVYDFDLMMNSGHITGYLIPDEYINQMQQALQKMSDKEYFENKYNISSNGVLLFAVGDGNHSLATAKTVWNNISQNLTEEEKNNHPARYALVELMNIHDEALEFLPIHRVVFGGGKKIIEAFLSYSKSQNGNFDMQKITVLSNNTHIDVCIEHPTSALAVGTLQEFLDDYCTKNELEIDYIHGDDSLEKLSVDDNIGFLLPSVDRAQVFYTVIDKGVLPRKTFSIGEADDKRFYVESRKIKL